jgi:molecular chaperone GrpE
VKDPKKKAGGNGDDDMYVLDDTGDSTIEDIEHEMEVAAQQAADTTENRRAKAAAGVDEAVGEENRQLKDRYMRTLADFENYRKRADREKNEFFKYALDGVLKDLIPILDNFDRALEHAGEGDEFHKGVALIYKQMWDVLQRHGLRPIEQAGVPFDPKIHEAVIREENPSVPSQTVVAVLQKGYFLHDRLLRPAMVKVAVGGPEQQG